MTIEHEFLRQECQLAQAQGRVVVVLPSVVLELLGLLDQIVTLERELDAAAEREEDLSVALTEAEEELGKVNL